MVDSMQIDFSMPPPDMAGSEGFSNNTSNLTVIQRNPMTNYNQQPPQFQQRRNFRPTHNNQLLHSLPDDFDGKRLRKSNMRKTVDYNCSISKALQKRIWQRDFRDRHALQPDVLYLPELMPPISYIDNPINAVTTRFVKTATNKMRCPIFCMAWTPEGRRLVTGASSGEFTLWNGLTFNFETILQAHDTPVRTMVWSHNDCWMITGDHAGYCKYWQSNMNNVKMFQAHKEAMRGLSFSPTDQKMVSCSDDGTLRIWDFATCTEERVLRGHGADVKCCGWHPTLGLIASGSKDNQQPIKLWDPKSGACLSTLHAHKSTVMDLKWNRNGNWFITASRDHFLKLFDIRNLGDTVQTFRGHKKEASCLAWHPVHEGLIASGGSDGSIFFWHVGADKEVGSIDGAHDSIVWALDWHPLGHILCSGSNDHTSKFWTRNRPGDKMRDRYNLNLAGPGQLADETETNESYSIPGMAPEDKVDLSQAADRLFSSSRDAKIPGLMEDDVISAKRPAAKRQPFNKPIPKNFIAQWNETNVYEIEDEEEEALEGYGTESVLDPITQILENLLENTPGVKKLEELDPNGLVAYGKVIPVKRNSILYKKIFKGRDELMYYISSGKVKELRNVPGFKDTCDGADSSDSEVDESAGNKTPTRQEMGVDRMNLEPFLKPVVLPEEKVAEEMELNNKMDVDFQEETMMMKNLDYHDIDYRDQDYRTIKNDYDNSYLEKNYEDDRQENDRSFDNYQQQSNYSSWRDKKQQNSHLQRGNYNRNDMNYSRGNNSYDSRGNSFNDSRNSYNDRGSSGYNEGRGSRNYNNRYGNYQDDDYEDSRSWDDNDSYEAEDSRERDYRGFHSRRSGRGRGGGGGGGERSRGAGRGKNRARGRY